MFAITSNEVDATLDTATILPFKCIENYTVDEFKECVGKNKRSPFLKVNLEDYEHKVNINPFNVYDILIPSDGSITFDPSPVPTLYIEPLFDYFVMLFDKKFLFPFANPLIAKRTFIPLQQNLTIFIVNLKVSTGCHIKKMGSSFNGP